MPSPCPRSTIEPGLRLARSSSHASRQVQSSYPTSPWLRTSTRLPSSEAPNLLQDSRDDPGHEISDTFGQAHESTWQIPPWQIDNLNAKLFHPFTSQPSCRSASSPPHPPASPSSHPVASPNDPLCPPETSPSLLLSRRNVSASLSASGLFGKRAVRTNRLPPSSSGLS